MEKENLNIKAVSHLSGLSEHTIRAWERRYCAVQPARTVTGHRTYTLGDVERLKMLGVLVNQGHTIRMVANLTMDDLKGLLTEHTHAIIQNSVSAPLPTAISASAQVAIDELVEALLRFELPAMGRLLAKARLRFDIRTFVLEICVPLMRAVGREVSDRHMTIAQEHALSNLLGDHLGQILEIMNEGNFDKPGLSGLRSLLRREISMSLESFSVPSLPPHRAGPFSTSDRTCLRRILPRP